MSKTGGNMKRRMMLAMCVMLLMGSAAFADTYNSEVTTGGSAVN